MCIRKAEILEPSGGENWRAPPQQATAQRLIEDGVVPPGVDDPKAFYGARGGVLPTESKDDFLGVFTRAAKRTATFKKAYDEPVRPAELETEPS